MNYAKHDEKYDEKSETSGSIKISCGGVPSVL